MADNAVFTDIGFEMLARSRAAGDAWAGYKFAAYVRWGEGGWEDVGGGVIQPKDPSLFTGNTDLEIVTNPGSYPGSSYATASPGLTIDQATEVIYAGGANELWSIIAALASAEENGNTFYEFGIWDNSGDAGPWQAATGYTTNQMVAYATIDILQKIVGRTAEFTINVPYKP